VAKHARKKKMRAPRRTLTLPLAPLRRALTLAVAIAAIAGTYRVATMALDVPIRALVIDGPFQRVTPVRVQEAISDHVEAGFVSVDLAATREALEALSWIDRAAVRRVWPDKLHITITEQVPAARWGERGLLNTRGELFVESARHVPAELPRLSGPAAQVDAVARRYLDLRGPLIEAGLGLRAIRLDPRGAWQFVLGNGIEVRLGRRDTEARADRFMDVAAAVVARHGDKIRYVDMRYSNGFSIGWQRNEFKQFAQTGMAGVAAAVPQRVR
jgi:cell division protein FtsQ